jgi:hypothetical protein
MSAVMSADDEESQNHQHNVRDEQRRIWLASFAFSRSAKTPSRRKCSLCYSSHLLVCFDEAGGLSNPTHRLSDRLRSRSYVKEHSSDVTKEKWTRGNFVTRTESH